MMNMIERCVTQDESMSSYQEEFISFQLCVQRALLGSIVPSIRMVTVHINGGGRFVTVIFDSPPTEEELELMSVAETELLADYPDNRVSVRVLTIPAPEDTSAPGIAVYARYEP